jgi:hypothetical protein
MDSLQTKGNSSALPCLANLHGTFGLHDIGFLDETVTITITKDQAMFMFKLLEPAAVVRPTFTALLTEMRRKGWI